MNHPAVLQKYYGTCPPREPRGVELWEFPRILQEESLAVPDMDAVLYGYIILYVPKAFAMRPNAAASIRLEQLTITQRLTDDLYRDWLRMPEGYRKTKTAAEFQELLLADRVGKTFSKEVRTVTNVADGKRYYAALLFGEAGRYRVTSPRTVNREVTLEIEYGAVSEEYLSLPDLEGEHEQAALSDLHLGEETSWD